MPRRPGKYEIDAIRESIKIACPHCHARLSGNEYTRLDSGRLRCKWCDGEFIPNAQGWPADARTS
jgi:uncharacterized CHY-type Zn-finger protein